MRSIVRIYIRQFYRKCGYNFLIASLLTILIFVIWEKNSELQYRHIKAESFFDGPRKNVERIKIDWHDYKQIEEDKKRSGPGEQGKPATLPDNYDRDYVDDVIKANGYDGVLSDEISLNRSVADIRHEECKTMQYLADLPSVSVVIPFYDEHFSVLMRNVHSVLYRSPIHLIKEVIIVDDGSEKS